ncbi:hypothetical protein BRAS3843_230008 [Bradyrhizobium sp. STM 3843]|nr:hypothetical protein BRAS3843_230008 [Bradyrhizobium sp. STM 3843]
MRRDPYSAAVVASEMSLQHASQQAFGSMGPGSAPDNANALPGLSGTTSVLLRAVSEPSST